jgi:hypothetical protein
MHDPTPTWINNGKLDLELGRFVLEDADFVHKEL